MAENKKIKGNEDELNGLFKETLDGLRDDLNEADENVQLYLEAITSESGGGKELYGSLYNDALKIKGSTRDRFLKFLALIKDRVGKKEDMAFRAKENTGSEFSINHGDLNDLVGKLYKAEGEGIIPVIIPKPFEEPKTRTLKPKLEEDGRDQSGDELDGEDEFGDDTDDDYAIDFDDDTDDFNDAED